MLGNNEKLEGVDLKAVFTKMLKEVPWENLKTYVLANAQLTKLCTIGGFRLEPKHRSRAESFILRDVEKGGYTELLCNGVFASWYPVHKELHQTLEGYFKSDEYKAWREDNKLGEDEYVLSDEKFNAFYKVEDFEAWRILLCFSPLKFTAEQAGVILGDKKDDADLMERLNNAEAERDSLAKKVAQLTAEAERLRSKQQGDQVEIQDLRKQNRQAKTELEQLRKRVDTAVAEMKRSNQQVSQADTALQQKEAAVREELGKVVQKQQAETARIARDLASLQSRYEEQCSQNKTLSIKAVDAEKRCAEALAAKEVLERRVGDSNKLIDSLLSRIDWLHVGSAMKLSPTMKRNFNSLVKRLDYDENRNLTIDGTLTAFWEHLSSNENALISDIARSTEKELINGSISDYWKGLSERFADVITNLEARMVMLGIMQDIFFQTYTDEDLQTPTVTPKTTKSKKS